MQLNPIGFYLAKSSFKKILLKVWTRINTNSVKSLKELVLFAHRVSRHLSTNYIAFFYCIPEIQVYLDTKHNLTNWKPNSNCCFDQDTFSVIVAYGTMLCLTWKCMRTEVKISKWAQEKQKSDFDEHCNVSFSIKVGNFVSLQNSK